METLHRLGLATVIICPGSRSTPLTLAAAQHPKIEAIPILDERSASFFGLGLAKRSHHPVALICTSGTAGANFYPAVIEAHVSRVPLLILTADRPPELRDCNAGQAIDQQKLYGDFVNWYSEMAIPNTDRRLLAYARQTMVAAWERSLYPTPGPVHLNLPFRDPLAPVTVDGSCVSPADGEALAQLAATIDDHHFFSGIQSGIKNCLGSPVPWAGCLDEWRKSDRGLIIVGPVQPIDPETYCHTVAQLSYLLGFPVLAEGLSPLRNYAKLNPYLISTYDMLVRDPAQAKRLAPDIVIRLGDMPTSKVLRQWLVQTDPVQWVIDPSDRNLDPTHGRTTHLRASIDELRLFLSNEPSDTLNAPPPAALIHDTWLNDWLQLEQSTRLYLEQSFEFLEDVCEPKVAWWLSRHLPSGTQLFISNSMPVRDVEWFWSPDDRHIQPYVNRGANGIDGIVSTALGVAYRGQASVLLTGDLAFLHDTNGLLFHSLMQSKGAGHLTIVLINNNGGGIFEMLPIAQMEPPFEEFFATPQSVNVQHLCHAYGIPHLPIASWEQLNNAFEPWSLQPPKPGIQVLEIHSDRRTDTQLRRGLLQQLQPNKLHRIKKKEPK